MNTESKESSRNSEGRLHDILETTGKTAAAAVEIGILKKRVERAVEDALSDAERAIKHGKHTFEDTLEDATYFVKKNPWQSVGYAVGTGLCVGFLGGWLLTRRQG